MVFGIWQAGAHHGAQVANEPGSFTWNECQTTDAERAAAFYEAVFGYDVDAMDMGGDEPYRVLEVGDKGVAGLMQMADGHPNWSTVFAFAGADDACTEAEKLGSSVLVPPRDIPTVGRFAVLRDPAGAVR